MSARGRRGGAFECPHCGAMVPARAKACRACGSDAGTGWQDGDEIDYQSLDIPDGYGPDDDGGGPPARAGRRAWWFAPVAVLTAAALLALAMCARG